MSTSPETSEVICRPTKWFIWRAILMLAMFGGFGAYFLYDWKIGYPKKNYIVANYQAFTAAGQAWAEHRENWEAFVAIQKIPFEDDQSIYPPGTDFEEAWPSILATMEKGNDEELWKTYSGEKGWPQKINVQEDRKPKRKITEQLVAAGVCLLLTCLTVFFLIRTKSRVMKVTAEGYFPPGGSVITFGKMIRLDKRKWETKGLATITYLEGEEEKKAKIDGMVYGQFREEDGAPAEALFQQVLANFQGELIELVEDEDEDEEEESDGSIAESEKKKENA
ncbi:MAG: hypothetical protein ACON5N_12445 [Akkermansiaceae bacterium]